MLDDLLTYEIFSHFFKNFPLFIYWIFVFFSCLLAVGLTYNVVWIALGLSLLLMPFVNYLKKKDEEKERQIEKMQEYEARKEYLEYMRSEQIKLDYGYCPNCNALVDDTLPQCSNCGFDLEEYT